MLCGVSSRHRSKTRAVRSMSYLRRPKWYQPTISRASDTSPCCDGSKIVGNSSVRTCRIASKSGNPKKVRIRHANPTASDTIFRSPGLDSANSKRSRSSRIAASACCSASRGAPTRLLYEREGLISSLRGYLLLDSPDLTSPTVPQNEVNIPELGHEVRTVIFAQTGD